jgi:hypothetical protein
MHNLNNFVLMISLSRLKNSVNKNFIELKNQNIINIYLKPNISEILKNENDNLKKELNIKNDELEIFIEEKNDDESISIIEESNFLFNSFIHLADSFKFDSDDWYLIYK